ncbi:hypothetical protein ACIP9H_39270 [Streptomyces sp. NPDC088732]|uniref:hypothetical protein n=1 Tax=Streptomyces sp. NPDC088732 TaxID=3365879 RepID=UPI0037FB8143
MRISNDKATAIGEEIVFKGTPGYPTFSQLNSLTDDEIKILHDLALTKNLDDAVSAEWLAANAELAGRVKDLLGTLQWSHQREIALFYREEITRREASVREARMERLTLIATATGLAALIVAIATVLITA